MYVFLFYNISKPTDTSNNLIEISHVFTANRRTRFRCQPTTTTQNHSLGAREKKISSLAQSLKESLPSPPSGSRGACSHLHLHNIHPAWRGGASVSVFVCALCIRASVLAKAAIWSVGSIRQSSRTRVLNVAAAAATCESVSLSPHRWSRQCCCRVRFGCPRFVCVL